MSWDPQWSVEAWLETLGLADYIDQFIDNGYDLQELCANLKGEDLDAIGVHSELHRKRIFAESSVLKDEATARFKKSNGGGSAGSTDHSGSMGSHGSFQATEPVSDEVSKHLYSEVWIGEQATVEGNGMPSALTQLMQNGGHGDTSGVDNKKKGPSGPPPKAPRKKGRTVTKPNYSTQTSLPALPPPRHLQPSGSSGSLNKVQLKLKVLEELQKDRIILSESPYCKEDGSMDKEKLSELCQTYSERFNIDPAQIMDTVSMICKATETKRGHDETDTSSQKTPVESSSNIYEEPADMMSNALTTFKESSPPSKPKRSKAPTVPAHGAEDVETEAVNTNPKHSPPLKKGKKKKGNAVLLQKPGSSSSDNSPEQERRVSPRTSPQPSPVTSPKEHKILGLFSKKKDKKAAQGLTVGDVNSPKQGKGGKAVLLPGKPEMKKSPEDTPTASPSLPLASKKRGGRGTLTNVPPPLTSLPSREPSNAVKHRTTSVSSASTTESESSPLAPKKFGILRFSARWGSQHHKAKTKRGKNNYQKSLTASDFELNKVGLKTDEEKKQELCLSRSHEELFDSRIAQNSPTISKKGSKHRGGGFFKLFKRMTVMTKGKEVGEREKGPTEDGEGSADEAETHENKGTFVSYIPSSFSMPNIASAAVKVTSEGSATTPKYHSVGIRVLVDKSAPSTPSYLHVQSPKSPVPLSPDPSPLLHRKVMQSEATPSNDHLIPIQNTDGGREGEMSSWQPHSPSHMMVQPTESFDSDVFSGINHENVCSFEDKRTSLGSCSDTVSDSSSVTSKNVPAAGSRASYGSVSGSYTSSASNASAATAPTSSRTASNASTATTRSLGSTQKPPPPPKPKSLDRSLLRSRGTTPPRKKQTTKDEDTASRGGSDIGTNERVIPPPKPPRPLRGSVKKTEVQRVEGENRGEERREGGEAKPPPKPPRRNRSMKAVGSEKCELTPQRKSQTLLPQSRSGSSASSTSVDSTPPGSVPYKPTPKPRSGTNVSVLQDQTVSTEASTLEENISAKLSEENIDLTFTPYSTVWGEYSIPYLLVLRYAQELDQPPEKIAFDMDSIRGQELKKNAREYVPVRTADCLQNTAISTATVADFLTSIGLPMYSSVLTERNGCFDVSSLRRLNDVRLEELGIIPPHRKILLEQLHKP